ncbi:hypothetical protein [Actinoplanes sp. HUAS TT8]|uniref:hypothetical protein n=1 Tax=Actinoplanes sp. HUAS TT8 TaxID=3447453 RepID=UPI003F51E8CF
MGYELHITRAFRSWETARYPIADAEVVDLVRAEADLTIPADAPRRDGFAHVTWSVVLAEREHHLLFQDGCLSVKHPEDVFVRRMIELAARLDAWVIGDDSELYEWDGLGIAQRDRDWVAIGARGRYLRRPGAPIRADEWAELVAAQSDFVMTTRVEATVPSGRRWVDCPPVPAWTGHPDGRLVPCFHDDDTVEVEDADGPVDERMRALAATLGAVLLDRSDKPV